METVFKWSLWSGLKPKPRQSVPNPAPAPLRSEPSPCQQAASAEKGASLSFHSPFSFFSQGEDSCSGRAPLQPGGWIQGTITADGKLFPKGKPSFFTSGKILCRLDKVPTLMLFIHFLNASHDLLKWLLGKSCPRPIYDSTIISFSFVPTSDPLPPCFLNHHPQLLWPWAACASTTCPLPCLHYLPSAAWIPRATTRPSAPSPAVLQHVCVLCGST